MKTGLPDANIGWSVRVYIMSPVLFVTFIIFSSFYNLSHASAVNHYTLMKGNRDASILKVDNLYYMVTHDNTEENRIPIYVSSNLKTWKFENHVFFPSNFPKWVNGTSDILHPELHYIEGVFVVYFTVHTEEKMTIGVATAATPTGPFKDVGTPLRDHAHNPNIVFHGKFILIYVMKNPNPKLISSKWLFSIPIFDPGNGKVSKCH